MLRKSLADSWNFFTQHFYAFAAIVFPFVAPYEVISALHWHFYGSETIDFVLATCFLIAYLPLYGASTVFYVDSVAAGKPLNVVETWRLGVRHWLPAFLITMLALAIIFTALIFLIVPALVIAALLAFSIFYVLLEKNGIKEALIKSWNETKPYFWVLFFGNFIILVLLYLPLYSLTSLFDHSSTGYFFYYYITNLLYWVLEIFFVVFSYRIYMQAQNAT